MPGRSTNLDNGRARAYCACSRCGCRLFGWLVGWLVVLGLMALRDSISVYIGPSPREREKEKRKDR